MTGHPDRLEVSVPSIGPDGVLWAARSEHGDYFDFELRNVPSKGIEKDVARVLGPPLIARISGYACKVRVMTVEVGVMDDGSPLGSAMLVLGNTTLSLPFEHGQPLAAFLGVQLEKT